MARPNGSTSGALEEGDGSILGVGIWSVIYDNIGRPPAERDRPPFAERV